MKIAYFDCYSGISGDMILGALVDLGADLGQIREALRGLPLEGFQLQRRTVNRCGIAATRIEVLVGDGGKAESETSHAEKDEHETHHHAHHVHDHPKTQPHPHEDKHGQRSFAEIESLLQHSKLSGRVRTGAADAYRRIAQAESHAHQRPVENIHFHEVGSIDAIVDITSVFIALELLDIEEVWSSEVTTGYGTVRTAHGVMPVPAPATALLLEGVPLRRGEIESELVTPTGAALLRTIAKGYGPWPEGFRTEKVGYGAGSKEFPRQTNYLRVFLGHRVVSGGGDRPAKPATPATSAPAVAAPFHPQLLTLVQTEIDDMSGEIYTHVAKRLFELGSYDVTLTPVQMKKNRPGVRIEVLCTPDRRDTVVGFLLRETTTFGVKVRDIERICLDRRFETVQTPFGPVRMKIGVLGDEFVKAAPEYEDCHLLAVEHNTTLLTVMDAARRAFEQRKG